MSTFKCARYLFKMYSIVYLFSTSIFCHFYFLVTYERHYHMSGNSLFHLGNYSFLLLTFRIIAFLSSYNATRSQNCNDSQQIETSKRKPLVCSFAKFWKFRNKCKIYIAIESEIESKELHFGM